MTGHTGFLRAIQTEPQQCTHPSGVLPGVEAISLYATGRLSGAMRGKGSGVVLPAIPAAVGREMAVDQLLFFFNKVFNMQDRKHRIICGHANGILVQGGAAL